MIKKTILFFLCIIYFFAIGQTPEEKKIDSLFNTINRSVSSVVNKTSDEELNVCTEVYYKSKEKRYIKGQVNALVCMTEIYSNAGDTEKSLVSADEGIELAKNNKDYVLQLSVFLLMKGVELSKLGYFDESLKSYKEALSVIDSAPEKLNNAKHFNKALIYFYINLSYERDRRTSLSRKEKEFYIQSAYKEALQITNDYPKKNYILTKSLQGLISAYTDWGELDKAEEYLKQADQISKRFQSSWPLTHHVLMGTLERKRGDFAKAVAYYEAALELSKSYKLIYDQKLIYELLSECYHEMKDYKNESYFLAMNKKLSDSIDIAEKRASGYMFKKKTEEQKNYNYLFIPGAIILLLIIVFVYYRRKNRFKKEEPVNFPDISEMSPLSGERDSNSNIQPLIEMAKSNNAAFYFQFKQVFPGFNQSLLHINPKMLQSDLEYCALIKLNFSSKEIAHIKKISVGAVESKKHRIRKKLNLSAEENIYVWLMDK